MWLFDGKHTTYFPQRLATFVKLSYIVYVGFPYIS